MLVLCNAGIFSFTSPTVIGRVSWFTVSRGSSPAVSLSDRISFTNENDSVESDRNVNFTLSKLVVLMVLYIFSIYGPFSIFSFFPSNFPDLPCTVTLLTFTTKTELKYRPTPTYITYFKKKVELLYRLCRWLGKLCTARDLSHSYIIICLFCMARLRGFPSLLQISPLGPDSNLVPPVEFRLREHGSNM